MNRFRPSSRPGLTSATVTLLLLFVLLFAQGLGLLHSISHAGLATPASMTATDQASTDEGDSSTASGLFDSRHSCQSFDAATLAFALALTGLAALLFARGPAPAVSPALACAALAPPRLFQPRAPPFLTA